MKFENTTPLHDLSPAIDPGVEKATGALFHRLHRVIIEVKASGGNGGYRKLNAISLEDLPVELRSSEREDELNAAIMLVALSHGVGRVDPLSSTLYVGGRGGGR